MNSLGSRVAGTILVAVGWLAFILLFFAFLTGNFNFWQNLAIILVSILVSVGVVTALWVKWALP
ncbi:hypothetical protein GWN63_04355 [Candidatus Bathyarchaeota archaeon]|nr:hypothetical protein [Candidatus Bathyarchaeota archaeon]NIU81459.1 hypothetical protein [Candidatus Bathyarchaeota archaeon]NIV68105.1 hypothetical protein [Candidatus Bathyarchaeota archaeon]NIW16015.1 hypothetical protein [Candidatus Bathyarchaeota archaeon]NIW34616.1 hypothetical protein [Candidatus Bathyarchaeota archaeon]